MRKKKLSGKKQAALGYEQRQTPAETRCGLCEREVQHTSRHHLVPREEGGRFGPTVELCQPCHSTVHLLLDNRELARRYHTVELLRTAEELQKYLGWVRRSRVEQLRNRRARR